MATISSYEKGSYVIGINYCKGSRKLNAMQQAIDMSTISSFAIICKTTIYAEKADDIHLSTSLNDTIMARKHRTLTLYSMHTDILKRKFTSQGHISPTLRSLPPTIGSSFTANMFIFK